MFPLLLIGGLVLFVLTRDTGRPKGPSEAESLLFTEVGGVLEYKREVAARILNSYMGRAFEFGLGPNVIIVLPVPAPPNQPDAFTALFQAHGDGSDIYAPTNAHLPIAVPVPILLLDPGAQPPAEGMARLSRAGRSFPIFAPVVV